jgi:hypothetical protein
VVQVGPEHIRNRSRGTWPKLVTVAVGSAAFSGKADKLAMVSMPIFGLNRRWQEGVVCP